jgi:hypothetical protein
MSKYTKLDADVMFMDTPDRVNYEFDLLNHDVDKNIEMSVGFTVIKNPKSLPDNFKDPKKIGLAILTVLIFVLTIVILIVLALYTYFFIKHNEAKREPLENILCSAGLLFVLLIIFYIIFNKLYGEMIGLITISKDSKPVVSVK